MLRADGRISAATVSTSVKNPVILPDRDPLSILVIREVHTSCAHAGIEHTLNELRRCFWIPKARSLVKHVLRKCVYCAKRRAHSEIPRMADLPADRFDQTRPLNIIGIDYFGPLEVKRLRTTEKRYVLLITCMSIRAVHLEVSHKLDTDSFLMALRRFCARRGVPSKIYSDNGTNLVGGENELRRSIQEWNQSQIADSLSQKQIEWHFIPPSAPHMGGTWERLVSTVKRSLRVVVGKLKLTDEVLQTFLTEVEFLVNSRPLTYVSSDIKDVEALTPNHFLLGPVGSNFAPGLFTHNDVIRRKQWRQAQALTDQLWCRWTREYFPTMLKRPKWCSEVKEVTEGDVVIMLEDNLPRGHWPLARVMRTFPGKDGRVRVAQVKTAGGSMYTRPVSKLCQF